MNKNKPLVSAIITTHNRSQLLLRAIDSVLSQSYKNLEIIVVDDASSDDTSKVMADVLTHHPQIQYLRNETPKGACQARNWGIKEANGAFIAGLDDDDEWLPNRIETFVNYYDPKYSIYGANDIIIFENGTEAIQRPQTINLDDMLHKNVFGNQGFIEKDRIVSIGGFDENLVAAQDHDMWLRLIEHFGEAKIIQEPLQKIYGDHRTTYGSITSSPKKIKGYFDFYKKHKRLMKNNHRKSLLFLLIYAKGKKINLKTATRLSHLENYREVLWYYLMKSNANTSIKRSLPALHKAVKKIAIFFHSIKNR